MFFYITIFIKFDGNPPTTPLSLELLLVLIVCLFSMEFTNAEQGNIDQEIHQEIHQEIDPQIDWQQQVWELIEQIRQQAIEIEQRVLQQIQAAAVQANTEALLQIIEDPLEMLNALLAIGRQMALATDSINEANLVADEIRQGLSIAREQLDSALASTLNNEYFREIDMDFPIYFPFIPIVQTENIDSFRSFFQNRFTSINSFFFSLFFSLPKELLPFFLCVLVYYAVILSTTVNDIKPFDGGDDEPNLNINTEHEHPVPDDNYFHINNIPWGKDEDLFLLALFFLFLLILLIELYKKIFGKYKKQR